MSRPIRRMRRSSSSPRPTVRRRGSTRNVVLSAGRCSCSGAADTCTCHAQPPCRHVHQQQGTCSVELRVPLRSRTHAGDFLGLVQKVCGGTRMHTYLSALADADRAAEQRIEQAEAIPAGGNGSDGYIREQAQAGGSTDAAKSGVIRTTPRASAPTEPLRRLACICCSHTHRHTRRLFRVDAWPCKPHTRATAAPGQGRRVLHAGGGGLAQEHAGGGAPAVQLQVHVRRPQRQDRRRQHPTCAQG